MADFYEEFTSSGVNETGANGQKLTVRIQKITREKNYEFSPGYTFDDAIVFHFASVDRKHKFTKGQSLLKFDKQPVSSKGMFRPFNWYNGKLVRATVLYDIKEAIKSFLGEEAYRKEKKEAGGKVSSAFLIGKNLNVNHISGEKSNSEVYNIYNLPFEQQYRDWQYMIDQGHVSGWDNIAEVRALFPEEFLEENNVTTTEIISPDQLPF